LVVVERFGDWKEKIRIMRPKIFLFLLLLFANFLLPAQDEATASPLGNYLQEDIPQQLFDVQTWEAAKEGIDYNQDIRVDRRDENFFDETQEDKQRNAERRSRSSSGTGSGIGSFLLKALLIIGLIVAVAMVVAQFIGGQGLKFRRNKTIDAKTLNIDVETVEEKLIESDLDRMIRLAEEDSNYALALRLQYLAGVKTLALTNHIKWKKGKTNRRYIYEIKNAAINKNFQEVTLVYERVWYGNSEIDLEDYQKLKPQFKNFIQEIERNPVQEVLTAINE